VAAASGFGAPAVWMPNSNQLTEGVEMQALPRLSLELVRLLILTVVVSAAGCGPPPGTQRLDRAMSQAGLARVAVYPLAGKVVADGEAPSENGKVVVMIIDSAKAQTPHPEPMFAVCDANGEFVFSTYLRGDGVPEGYYLVTLAQLVQRRDRTFVGPDQFKNLYSDPETSDLRIEHRAPGRTDYVFELQIAGRDAVSRAGRMAPTRFFGRNE
jgi:hypothetical protein